MCLSPSASPPREIGLYWSDAEVCTNLQGFMNGSPLPANVISDANPYQHKPSNLPEGIWYFTTSEDYTKCAEGFWKPRGETCVVFKNSSVIGSRTTLEFYEGTTPNVLKTDWVMQQYNITQDEKFQNSKAMASSSLCRVFQSGGHSSNHEMPKKLAGANVTDRNQIHSSPVLPNTDNSTGPGSKRESRVQHGNGETGLLAALERPPNHPVDDQSEIDGFPDGDFLELIDLDEPVSPSSSDNSSCLSQISDESFDLSFLQGLESSKDVGCKFSVAAPVNPDNVVFQPASSGSLTPDDRKKLLAEESPKTEMLPEAKGLNLATATQEAENKGGGSSSNPQNVVAPSAGSYRESDGKDRKKRPKKNYFCNIPSWISLSCAFKCCIN